MVVLRLLDGPEYERWRRATDSSLTTARLTAEHGQHHHACLHAEQAAQLAIKGLLHGAGAGARVRGHDLSALAGAVVQTAGSRLPEEAAQALGRLARHYLPSRYPDALPGGAPSDHYTAADSAQALADAELIVGFVAGAWSALEAAADQQPASGAGQSADREAGPW